MIDETFRERFIFHYKEQIGFSTVDFGKRAITYFEYASKQLQIDNGAEFTNFSRTKRVHIFDKFCLENGIEHKLIRPRTPWYNGKVERSHHSDQEHFNNYLRFYSYDNLLVQMKRYLRRFRSGCAPLRRHKLARQLIAVLILPKILSHIIGKST